VTNARPRTRPMGTHRRKFRFSEVDI
jgi:hypothetical protein